MTCQVSLMFARSRRKSTVRLIALPFASRRGLSAVSKTVECPPIQVALALALANRHLPVTRYPPSTAMALATPAGGPHAISASGAPKTSRATFGSRNPAACELAAACALPCRRRHRYARALARRATQPQMGSNGNRGEYWRRGGQYRLRRGRARNPGRLHAAVGFARPDRDQRFSLQRDGL